VRLKYRIAVREDDGRAELAQVRERLERARIQAPGERIAEEKSREPEDSGILQRLEAEALHRAQIIRETEFPAQRLEDSPEALAPRDSELLFEMRADVRFDAVVVQQRVVHVK
jgi:hypothetical protein